MDLSKRIPTCTSIKIFLAIELDQNYKHSVNKKAPLCFGFEVIRKFKITGNIKMSYNIYLAVV